MRLHQGLACLVVQTAMSAKILLIVMFVLVTIICFPLKMETPQVFLVLHNAQLLILILT